MELARQKEKEDHYGLRKLYKQRYGQFCSKAYFENTNFFQPDSYIKEKFEHNANLGFA